MSAEICQLRPGHQILRVIKGGWQLAGGHGSVDRTKAIADMSAFFDAGIRTFD
jgi:aryl-alcohol dehydrogenase-like predicted oxidoreductase